MSPQDSEIYNFVIELAREAGDLILRSRNEGDLSTKFKGPRDMVTKADVVAEQLIVSRIKARFPEDSIIAEESHTNLVLAANFNGRLWVIDPIDGTSNYARGHSYSCVSIALCVDSEIKVGVVYSPFQNELFRAQRGGGAFLNDKPIRVSDVSDLQSAMIVTGRPKELSDIPEFMAMLEVVMRACHDFRRFGSAALDICGVACGRVDAFFESLNPWDIAAACLIAAEAGAIRTHFAPPPKDFSLPNELYALDLLVASPAIAAALAQKLAPVKH